jgi:hypothetical protein
VVSVSIDGSGVIVVGMLETCLRSRLLDVDTPFDGETALDGEVLLKLEIVLELETLASWLELLLESSNDVDEGDAVGVTST